MLSLWDSGEGLLGGNCFAINLPAGKQAFHPDEYGFGYSSFRMLI
jgi:hypothetical protein